MARKPEQWIVEAGKKTLDPQKTLNTVINEMNNPELEKALVEAGVAKYVEKETQA